jgi:DNA-binding transcriptional LysR family regulator
MLDQITHLFRLKAIVEEGSLHRAAERLNVSQPALSRSISQLETLFGRQLLERHARGVRPTPFGRKVLSASLRLRRQWELAEQELRDDEASGNVCLRIGAGPVWRAIILPAVMVEIQRSFPKVVFEIYRAHPTRSYEELSEGRLDVILSGVSQETQYSRLMRKKLAVVTNHVVAREGHPIFERVGNNGLVPHECLLDYPWLVYLEYPVYREATIHAIYERIGRDPEIRLICDSLNTTIATLQRSDYLAHLPEPITIAAAAPRLLPIPVDLKRRHVDVGMVIREELEHWEPVKALERACAEVMAKAVHL